MPELRKKGCRRLIVNGCLWTMGLDVPEKTKVDLVGEFKPTPFKFHKDWPGKAKPSDFAD